MKTYKQMLKIQNELDAKLVECPKCEKIDSWGIIREYGACGNCVAEGFKKEKEKRSKKIISK